MMGYTGILMLAGAAALAARYRPRGLRGRILLVLTGLMGLMALIAGSGGPLFQAVQIALQAVVAACCAAELRGAPEMDARREPEPMPEGGQAPPIAFHAKERGAALPGAARENPAS